MQDDSAEDLAAFGAPAEMVESAKPDPDQHFFGVWEENAGSLMMFMRMQTQWNVVNGCFLGLNYASAAFLFKIHGVENASELMDDLQAMELAALQVLNKRKE